jgi:hypothetical protein
MRHTGVGALPLLPLPGTEPQPVPTEQQLIEDTTRAVQALYEQLKRVQDAAAIVANVLGTRETASRPPK